MKTTIDRAGRVVIPKAIREQAGLRPGVELEIRVEEGVVEIIRPAPRGRLVQENGFTVWEPGPDAPALAPDAVSQAIEALRREREDDILRGVFGLEDRS
jgi:AbrB family looped-hinge helix DNA binding protein